MRMANYPLGVFKDVLLNAFAWTPAAFGGAYLAGMAGIWIGSRGVSGDPLDVFPLMATSLPGTSLLLASLVATFVLWVVPLLSPSERLRQRIAPAWRSWSSGLAWAIGSEFCCDKRLLAFADQRLHLHPGPGIGHVLLGQPRPAGLQDAVAQYGQAVGAVSIGRNHDRNAVRLGRGAGHIVQVEPGRVGVQFQQLALIARGTEHGLQVNVVGLAAVDQPAGRMGDGRDIRIGQRSENALRDLLARLVLAVMDAGHDPIGLGQHVVRQVEAASFQDVDFNPFEHAEFVQPRD